MKMQDHEVLLQISVNETADKFHKKPGLT